MKKTSLWDLYFTFFKIGGLTFGGGYAMLPLLQEEVVNKRRWASEEELLDMYAIGQVTPGIIAVNTATMVGYRKRGILGGIIATLGEISPSILIITTLATILLRYKDAVYLQQAFVGIRIAVCATVTVSIIKLMKKSLVDLPTVLFYLLVVASTLMFSLSPIIVVIVAILFGIVVQNIKCKKERT
ncbi:MAG: chromate transporter [Sphaerochaeta sp.]|jgi:chromate transporter|nr:MAG: chromate transporter [Sphaerochaeta sp.]HPB42621.1 chromate transporter [Sphaerochaeta sp.]HPY45478.1 chromate transporter [Sphaerochaeta sp.]HQB05356.1 chromate transporter [Sphaerochaeta sp.]